MIHKKDLCLRRFVAMYVFQRKRILFSLKTISTNFQTPILRSDDEGWENMLHTHFTIALIIQTSSQQII